MVTVAKLQEVKSRIETVEAEGFGEVIVKVKNGVAYRVIHSVDTMLDKKEGKE